MTIHQTARGRVRAGLARSIAPALLALFAIRPGNAQFTSSILANDSYWSDGKAEFNIYDAQLVRDGQSRHCELLHILVREKIDPKTYARIDDPKQLDALNAIRMNQIWTAPIGMLSSRDQLPHSGATIPPLSCN